MGPGAALSPGFGAHGDARRKHAVLALTLALHLLGAWFWLQEKRLRPAPPDAARVVTILLQLPAERPRAPAPAPAPAPVPAPVPVPVPAPARPPESASAHPRAPARAAQATSAAPRQEPAAAATPAPVPAPAETPAPPRPDTLAAPQPAPAPADGAALARDAATAADGFTLVVAKRQAGRIDHELRGGKSGVPKDPDTPWGRFVHGLEAAHVESSLSAHLDSYTSPDGVVIYRRRVGAQVRCYRTGSVGLGVAGARGVNDAGPTSCPTGVIWKREE